MGSCQQEQAGDEGPEHQADGDGEGTVDRMQIHPGESRDVQHFCQFPGEADDDGGRQYCADGQLAVGKNPIDEEEQDDTGYRRRNLQQPMRDKDKAGIINVAEEQDAQNRSLRRGDGDA